MSPKAETIRAVVEVLCGVGRRQYAVCYPREGQVLATETTITFTLKTAWKGDRPPAKGQVVLLTCVEEFARGWRAQEARPVSAGKAQQGSGESRAR